MNPFFELRDGCFLPYYLADFNFDYASLELRMIYLFSYEARMNLEDIEVRFFDDVTVWRFTIVSQTIIYERLLPYFDFYKPTFIPSHPNCRCSLKCEQCNHDHPR